ncbi:30S ribosomal protein S9 [Candidatus Parcubacteria bacterium]|nr:MAG: 30S ribosomal protein S9 [Candidatus Parcubacteria bacterium]
MNAKNNEYTEAVGRRKEATARVRLSNAKSTSVTVNGKDADKYFPLADMISTIHAPLKTLGVAYAVSAKVQGGGLKAQATAMRHAISRALVEITPDTRKELKLRGYLKRDPRAKERKKFGLKGARRSPQWSKR